MTLFACAITGQRRVGRPFLEASIANKKSKVLYDTGADISCIDEKEFRKIPLHKRPSRNLYSQDRQFLSASGNQLKVKGAYNIQITIMGKTVTHPFFVVSKLSDPVILGADFIHENKLAYCPEKRDFFWKSNDDWTNGVASLTSSCVLPAFSVCNVKVNLVTQNGSRPNNNNPILIDIQTPKHHLLSGGPGLVKPDHQGQATVEIRNCGPDYYELNRGQVIGILENAQTFKLEEIKQETINEIIEKQTRKDERQLSKEDEKFIEENAKINVPEKYAQDYLNLLKKHHMVFSRSKTDLGRSDLITHEIHLKTEEPVYVKQFKMPDVHRDYLEEQVKEWLKLGIVQPTRSRYNSPMFLVNKKDGGFRVVQDFRALNSNSHIDKYTMKDVSECIGEIGRSNSTIFSTLDLTSGFWQMLLHPKSRPYTAFTIPGMGQFQWVTSAMGLLGCPSTFQRLVEAVVQGLANIIVYIDDLIVHSNSHEDHLQSLDQLFTRLQAHNLKVNLKKCVFGSKDVMYLGFHLTESGIKPGTDKLKAVGLTEPPKNVHEIRQFLGLCNFFRTHVRNFAQVSSPLTALTRKDSPWKTGPLPDDALKAFRELQTILCSEPVVDYPRRDRPYALITDAALGDDKKDGGLGAILSQVNEKGEFCVIAYASRKLQKHEKNYTPFLLEMQAAIWAMDHFSTYLRGRHFTLYTDHKPLEKLGKVHTRTFHRLQEIMNTFDFKIEYKKGSEMPADFLSRNVVSAIQFDNLNLSQQQQQDPFLSELRQFLLHKKLPLDENTARLIMHLSNDVFIENDVMWRRIKTKAQPGRVVVLLPRSLVKIVLEEAHGHLLTGHDGTGKTKQRLMLSYWWPKMDKDIEHHISTCRKCQIRRVDHAAPPQLLSPLPQCTEPNQRMHCDLFGPLKISGNEKKYILCMTDAFTKYVELVAVPDKEALTVTSAIFNRWICRYGTPLEIISDQGREFNNKLSAELYELLQLKHQTTSARHPQCNASAEVCNKTIAKYLNSFVNETTLDWELYLAPLMFCYNTSFHRSVKNSPYFLTYGMDPRLPAFPAPDIRRVFYGESDAADLHHRLLTARKIAAENNSIATEKTKEYFDNRNKAKSHSFVPKQLVLLEEYNFLGRNTKLCPKWSGPHTILSLKGTHCAELLLLNNRKTIVNIDRIKPYFSSENEDHLEEPNTTTTSASDDNSLQLDDLVPSSPLLTPNNNETHQPTPPTLVRKRGRPPKTSLSPSHATSPAPHLFQNNGGIIGVNVDARTKVNERMTTRSQSKHVVAYISYVNELQNDVARKLEFKVASNKREREKQIQKNLLKCKCPTLAHDDQCSKEWRKIKHLLKVFKREDRYSDHSFESAELDDEELLLFDELPFHSDDDGYGGSSPIPIPINAGNPEVQQQPVGEVEVRHPSSSSPDSTPEQLSPIPKGTTTTTAQLVPPTNVVVPNDLSQRSFQDETTTDEFHSIDDTIADLNNSLADLEQETEYRLQRVETQEEYDIILHHFHQQQQQLQQQLQQLQPAPQPTTSTPQPGKKKKSPAAQLDQFLFGSTSSPRHTRRHGEVEDVPLPNRPAEYRPYKKK